MCVKEEVRTADRFTVGETPVVEVSEDDVAWTPPNNKYMRCMNAWKSRPSFFSVVGKTARTVNLLEFFDWMDEQKLKTQRQAATAGVSQAAPAVVSQAAPAGVSQAAPAGISPAATIGAFPTVFG